MGGVEAASQAQGLSSAEAAARLKRLGLARAGDQPLGGEHRRGQRLHALQRDPRRLLRDHARAGAVRRRPVRADRRGQLGDRYPPGAEGEGDAGPARAARRPQGPRDPRRAVPSSSARTRSFPETSCGSSPATSSSPTASSRSSRGLTMDESILTGESDGVRKREGDRLLSGAFCIAGSGYYELDAVRDQSHAEKVAGEARAFRHPLSPLQVEVNSVLRATTIADDPARRPAASCARDPQRPDRPGGPDRHRRPRHADPGGPRPADERHAGGRRGPAGADEHPRPADGRHRGARRRRHDLRRQDRARSPTAPSAWFRSRSPTRRSPRSRTTRSRGSRTRPASGTARSRRSPSAIPASRSGSLRRSRSRRCGSGAG